MIEKVGDIIATPEHSLLVVAIANQYGVFDPPVHVEAGDFLGPFIFSEPMTLIECGDPFGHRIIYRKIVI